MRADPGPLLKTAERSGLSSIGRTRRLRTLLIVFEVAVSVVLLVGAGLMLRTLIALHSVDPGFNSGRILTLQAIHPRSEKVAVLSSALDHLRALPGVETVSAVRPLPFESLTMDGVTLAAVSMLLAGVSLAACYAPARRATRIDPAGTLNIS